MAWDATSAVVRQVHDAEPFDLVVVDPPRRGLTPALREAIADLAPRAIAYVSCDPSTLARDLAHLAHRGWRAPSVEPWDFIPLSAHVEAFAWLEPAPPPPVRVLARRGGLAVVDLPAYVDPKRFAERVGRELGVVGVAAPTWPGASGALVVGRPAAAQGETSKLIARVVAAVRGRPKRGLTGPWRSLEVLRTSEGRSRVVIETTLAALPRLGRALARAGHTVVGDAADGPTARHLAEKHGIGRPLVHVVYLDADGDPTTQPPVSAPIPGDLTSALVRLDLA
jgi:23S rRNA (uracil1939-C5)-methyltransferase